MQENITVKIGADISELSRNLKTAQTDIGGFGSKIAGVMKGVGLAVVAGGAVAATGFVALSKSAITSAAEMQAINSQFEQVFGDLGSNAQKSINEMADEFGMVPSRLKPAFTTITSMFKGLGLDTESAMEQAAKATKLTADAAAFYDKSFEDANASLNSFIKGNYEGGEAIGLFANETQLSKWAADELGVSWKDLDEAGKQVARLKFAEAMQSAAGATGQAARESDGLQNLLGNLSAVWEDLMVQFGTPILPIVTEWLKKISSAIQNFDATPYIEGFKAVWEGLDTFVRGAMDAYDTIKSAFSGEGGILGALGVDPATVATIMGLLGTLKENFSILLGGIKTVVKDVFGFFKEYILPLVGEVVAFVIEKMAEMAAFWDANGAQILQAVKNVWNGIKAVIDFVMPAVLFIIKMVWDNIKGVINGALKIIKGLIKVFAGIFTGDFSKMWEGIKDIFFGAIEAVWNLFNLLLYGRLLKAGAALFKGLKGLFTGGWAAIKSNATTFFNWIKSFADKSFNGMRTAISNAMAKVVTAIKTKWNESVSFLKGINLREIGKNIITGFINGIKSMLGNVKGIITDLASSIPAWAKKVLGIHSPSKVFADIGMWTGRGLVEGLDGETTAVERMAQKLANASIAKPTLSYNTPSVSGNVRSQLMRQAHEVNSQIEASLKPANINVTLGQRDYEVFVSDISDAQSRNQLVARKYKG